MMYIRLIYFFLLNVFLLAVLYRDAVYVSPEVVVPLSDRVSNKSPGFCCWACIETIGNFQKNPQLKNLMERRALDEEWYWTGSSWINTSNYGTSETISSKLNAMRVSFEQQFSGNLSYKLIQKSLLSNCPCMCVIDDTALDINYSHAILIIYFDKHVVKYIDPNDTEWNYIASRRWFDKHWTGYVLYIPR